MWVVGDQKQRLESVSIAPIPMAHTTVYKIDNQQSTRNSTQDFVINYKGKESEKNVCMCVCITESLCCIPEANTTS